MAARKRSSKPVGGERPRIRDVAEAAGVSTATVSRALTFPDQVREGTRNRVVEAVRRLGYTPNAAARNLCAGISKMILVVVPRRANPPFFSEVLRGIDTVLTLAGYGVIMGSLDMVEDGTRTVEKERLLVDFVHAGHLDGMLMLTGIIPQKDGRSLDSADIPMVAICADPVVAGVPSVVIDDRASMVHSTRHLLDLGHRRLVYLSGPEGNYNEVKRYDGFLASVREAGLAAEDVVRLPGDYLFTGGIAAAHAFLAMADRPTGIVCCNDEMAIGFMKTIQAAGLHVPHDVSVVGFDGIEFADFCEPTLTTIRQPRFELGATGARLLLARLAGAETASMVLESELVLRASTATPSTLRSSPRKRGPSAELNLGTGSPLSRGCV